MCGGMKEVSNKKVESSLQKIITWTKKLKRENRSGLKLVKMHLFTLEN
jgi:hypothetical protein